MTGLPVFSRWCWFTKISHSLQKKNLNGKRKCQAVFCYAAGMQWEKRGNEKSFYWYFSIDDQLRQKAAHSMERTYKAATELSVRCTCRRKHPLLFSHALWSRPETFQTNFATTICSWPIAFSETHLTAKKSTKCHFSLQKKTKCHQVSLSSNHLVQFCWSPVSKHMRWIMNQETATLHQRGAFREIHYVN